jgi:hypothetical protein
VIDPEKETLVPLKDAAGLFPPRRRRSKDDPSNERTLIGYATLLNLCVHGDRKHNIKLESLLLGHVIYTYKHVINRFLRAVGEASARPATATETPRQHERRIARAKADAERALHPPPKPKRKPGCKAAAEDSAAK